MWGSKILFSYWWSQIYITSQPSFYEQICALVSIWSRGIYRHSTQQHGFCLGWWLSETMSAILGNLHHSRAHLMNSMDFTLAGGGGCTQGGTRGEGREGAQSSAGQRGAHQGESSRERERRAESRELETLAERVYREQLKQDIISQQIFSFLKTLLSETASGQDKTELKLEAEVQNQSNISWFEKSLHHQPGWRKLKRGTFRTSAKIYEELSCCETRVISPKKTGCLDSNLRILIEREDRKSEEKCIWPPSSSAFVFPLLLLRPQLSPGD